MSVSVSNYIYVMEERQRALRNTLIDNITESGVGVPSNSPVKRCLFGSPDPVELKRKYEEIHEEERKRGAKKWGFDFETETPLENSRYQWERVASTSSVPKAYELSHLGPSESQSSPVHESGVLPSLNNVEAEEVAPSSPLSESSSSDISSSSATQQSLMTDHFGVVKNSRRKHRSKHSESGSSSAEKRQCIPGLVPTSSNEATS